MQCNTYIFAIEKWWFYDTVFCIIDLEVTNYETGRKIAITKKKEWLFPRTAGRPIGHRPPNHQQMGDRTGGAGIKWLDQIAFLIRAKHNTYAGKGHEVKASRVASHDYAYEEKEYSYYDTYLGGEQFAGEEAVWYSGEPVWSMNYVGRVLGEHFDIKFLREVLYHVPEGKPFRGPEIYTKGDYHYHCKVEGGFVWYQGYEEIFYLDEKVYECYFHGGVIR